MPCSVASCSATDASARPARPSSTPIPAITHMPCGSMKICPSSHAAEPTARAEVVVRTDEPLAVPSMREHDIRHRRRDVEPAVLMRDRRELTGGEHEQASDEHRLGDATLSVLGRLERLARLIREAVEVEAVVPVSASDQRQTVRTEPVERVLHRAARGARDSGRLGARPRVVRHEVSRGSTGRLSPSGTRRPRARATTDRR